MKDYVKCLEVCRSKSSPLFVSIRVFYCTSDSLCACVHTYIRMYRHTYICTYVHMYVHTYICTDIRTYCMFIDPCMMCLRFVIVVLVLVLVLV